MHLRRNAWVALVASASLLTACADAPTAVGPTLGDRALISALDPNSPFAAAPGTVKVCTFSNSGLNTYPRGNYNATATSGTLQQANPFSVGLPEECKVVWVAGATNAEVSVSLIPSSSYALARIAIWYSNDLETDIVLTGTNTATVSVGPTTGAAIWFKLDGVDTPPPPPPPGGEGCTPGYWKQKQHFDSWPAPYTPNTQFSSVFADAFPGMTLLQVVSQGGGGIKALGRHAVAALLNSASDGVNYDLSTAAVISGFNSAFASGNAETIETQHILFMQNNEDGCRLN